MNIGNKSSKSIKRESIANGVGSLASLRKNSVQKPRISAVKNEDNKENVSGEDNVVVQMDVNVNAGGSGEGDFSKDIEGLHVDVNTLNLGYEELKMLTDELRKRDAKHHAALIEVEDKQKRIQDEMRKDSDNFDKQLKMIQVNLLNKPSQKEEEKEKEEKSEPQDKRSPSSRKTEKIREKETREARESTINFKDELNDKLSKIQASLQGFVTETEFNRFKTETR